MSTPIQSPPDPTFAPNYGTKTATGVYDFYIYWELKTIDLRTSNLSGDNAVLRAKIDTLNSSVNTLNQNLIATNANMNTNQDQFSNSYNIKPGFHPIIIESLLCVAIAINLMSFVVKVAKK